MLPVIYTVIKTDFYRIVHQLKQTEPIGIYTSIFSKRWRIHIIKYLITEFDNNKLKTSNISIKQWRFQSQTWVVFYK